MKFILHLVFFAAGAAGGIWWGVHHPVSAQNISVQEDQRLAQIQAAVSDEKIKLLNQFLGNGSSKPELSTSEFKQMLSAEKQKLMDAKSKLGS